jgi:hypothetical protein
MSSCLLPIKFFVHKSASFSSDLTKATSSRLFSTRRNGISFQCASFCPHEGQVLETNMDSMVLTWSFTNVSTSIPRVFINWTINFNLRTASHISMYSASVLYIEIVCCLDCQAMETPRIKML